VLPFIEEKNGIFIIDLLSHRGMFARSSKLSKIGDSGNFSLLGVEIAFFDSAEEEI
jgi:hypothetical protein